MGYEVVNFKALPQLPANAPLTTKDIEKVVPYRKLNVDDDMGSISNKILDQSVNSFLQSDYVQQTSFAKTAKSVEEGARADISFGSKDSKIQHKVSLQYEAFQKEAKIGYKGLVDLQVKYNTISDDYQAELTQKVNGKEFVLGHKVVTDDYQAKDDVSTVSMRWNW